MSKILVAEDEIALRMGIEKALTDAGFEVFLAADGQEALDLMREELPDLIFLDVMMPVKSGTDVLQEMRSDPLLESLKVVVLTNYDFGFMKEDAELYGVEDYLVKSNILLQDLEAMAIDILRPAV